MIVSFLPSFDLLSLPSFLKARISFSFSYFLSCRFPSRSLFLSFSTPSFNDAYCVVLFSLFLSTPSILCLSLSLSPSFFFFVSVFRRNLYIPLFPPPWLLLLHLSTISLILVFTVSSSFFFLQSHTYTLYFPKPILYYYYNQISHMSSCVLVYLFFFSSFYKNHVGFHWILEILFIFARSNIKQHIYICHFT